MLETGGRYGRTVGDVRLPYLPGLDGLRALAVIAVLLFHAGLTWIPGGFLGVEVFFVISGYLITSLLLAEWHGRGRVDLKAFWLGRARRLLPALYLVLTVTLTFAVLFLPDEVAKLRGDAVAAFGYVINWYLVFGQESYFETVGRPSLLQHLWSLAIEEQFYVLWPLVFAVGMGTMTARWRRRGLLVVALAGAAASALLMATLYQPGVDPSRIYYGTDTRAAGLLVGVALAFVWEPGRFFTEKHLRRALRRHRTGHRPTPLLPDVLGLAALGGLIWFCLRVDETQPFLFDGGFALVAFATAVVITIVVYPRAYLGSSLLGRQPLRWIGLRSYGIYLWHWPVFMVSRPQLDVPLGDGLPLLALRLAATIVLADLSYRFVETPIRWGALGRAWRSLREAQGARRWRLGAGWAGAVGTSAACCVALGLAVAHAQPPDPPSYLSAESIHTSEASSPTPENNEATTETAPAKTPAAESASADPITVVGDSVMIGAAEELNRALNNPAFGADVGLQPAGVIEILQKRRAAGRLGETVVVHTGNNGSFTAEQFDEIMRVLADVPRVVFVNVKVPRPWEQRNNEVIAEGVQRYPNTMLADWHAASADRPELF
ncbi:MAG: acyltransferase, partial [Actinomycetota bacterium]|nr:acyltransferase [Actinomycetota bacterium]